MWLIKRIVCLLLCASFAQGPLSKAHGQFGGIILDVYGMVSLAPGRKVLSLAMGRGENIRFRVQDVVCQNPNFSTINFLSEVRHRRPSLYIKGPERHLGLLRAEEPERRLLRLTGLYYPGARNFVLSRVRAVRPGERQEKRY